MEDTFSAVDDSHELKEKFAIFIDIIIELLLRCYLTRRKVVFII